MMGYGIKNYSMLQIIFHLIGDYVTQNHWMATKKVLRTDTGVLACLVHCILYTLPFILITTSGPALAVIFFTHYFIDHYRLAKYFIQLRDWNFKGVELQPPFLSVWLLIICDNTFHVTINYLALKYL